MNENTATMHTTTGIDSTAATHDATDREDEPITTPPERFPWPLTADTFRYHTNVHPAPGPMPTAAGVWGEHLLDIDDAYLRMRRLRAEILAAQPQRAVAHPHMHNGVWDALLWILSDLAAEYPQTMSLHRDGGRMHWHNGLTGEDTSFVIGDDDTLPAPPLVFAAMQIQEDLQVLDDREGHLWVDAMAITFNGTWSNTFAPGMSFQEIHGPVPRIHAIGMVDRTEAFLRRVPVDRQYRRLAWTINVSDRLDVSLENFPTWGVARLEDIMARSAYGECRLRVEVQNIIHLPLTGQLLFAVKTHLCPLEQVMSVPAWGTQLRSVIAELPEDMAQYKGFGQYRPQLLEWMDTRLARTPATVSR